MMGFNYGARITDINDLVSLIHEMNDYIEELEKDQRVAEKEIDDLNAKIEELEG